MKKFYLASISAILILCLSLTALGVSLPTVEIVGSKFYVYQTKKGDTFFSIAANNNWDVAELQRINPDAASPFKKGTFLFYPVDFLALDSLAPVDSIAVLNEKDNTPDKVKDLYHTVSKGETVSGIAMLYTIPEGTVYHLNPGARLGLNVGDRLLLRSAETSVASADTLQQASSRFYTVGPDETLREIANTNNVSVEAILEINPGLSQTNCKEGVTLILPEEGKGIEMGKVVIDEKRLDNFVEYQVRANETWDSIAANTGFNVELIKEVNPGVKNPKKNQIIALPHIVTVTRDSIFVAEDPRQTSLEGIDGIYNDLHKVAVSEDKKIIKYAIIAETPNGRKDLEFIRGFLTGINELKSEPYKIDVKVIDGTRPAEDIIIELDEYKPTIVFITADKNIPSYIGEYASVSQTPVVNTFDMKNESYNTNPYMIQLMTPSNYFNDCVASNAYNVYGSSKLVMIGEEDASDQLAAALKKLWKPEDIKYLPTQAFEALDVSDVDGLLFYGYPTKKEEVEQILTNVSSLRQSNATSNIAVLGRPNWIVFNESLKNLLYSSNTSIPSRFYIDEGSALNKKFQAEYNDLFHRAPVRTVPLYAGVGYDSAIYFTTALEDASLDVNMLAPSKSTLQSQFDFKRVSNWGGLINMPVYLVQYSPLMFTSFVVIE